MTNIFLSGTLYCDKKEKRETHANVKAFEYLRQQYWLKLELYQNPE